MRCLLYLSYLLLQEPKMTFTIKKNAKRRHPFLTKLSVLPSQLKANKTSSASFGHPEEHFSSARKAYQNWQLDLARPLCWMLLNYLNYTISPAVYKHTYASMAPPVYLRQFIHGLYNGLDAVNNTANAHP